MEDPSLPREQLREALEALDRTHRWFGTFGPVTRLVKELLTRVERPLRVLDVGAGSGFLGRRLHQQFGEDVSYFRLDPSRRILVLRTGPGTEWKIQGRGPRFPVRSGSIDLVVSSLVLHHLPDHQLRPFLLDCLRLSRGYVLHHDLRRRWELYLSLWLIGRMFTGSPVYRHDAPLSVQRSRTLGEWREILRQQGLESYRVEPMFPWRINLIARAEDPIPGPEPPGQSNRSPAGST